MKLFFLIESLYKPAGTERISTDVANAMYEKTHWDIQFVTLSSNTDSHFRLNANIPVKSIHGSITSPVATIRNLRALVKKERPDCIINVAAVMSRFSIPASLLTRTKVITWEHFNLFAGSKLGYLWRLCSATFSHKTVVLTCKDRASYPRALHKKVQTIYNFPTPVENGLSDLTSNIAISVGRLTPQKGFDILLKVWELVHHSNKEWELYIIGSGEDEEALKQQCRNLGLDECIKFIPSTPKIRDFYQQASLYIMSSRFEGLPLVLIEAKQQGLPCISFDCPNGPKEIIRQGIDGELVPLGDIQQMAKSILSLVADRNKIKQYGKAAYQDVNERFSRDAIIKEWITLLGSKL